MALHHVVPVAAAPARRPPIPMKTKMGPVDDPLEREADQAADAVMRMSEPATMPPLSDAPQRKGADGGNAVSQASAEVAARAVASGGTPLSPQQRRYFEPRFGRDLTNVRIHTDGDAASAAADINARAYALGDNIAFAPGEYDPRTPAGTHLLAHELAHVGQQAAGTVIQRKIRTDPQAPIDTYLRGKGVVAFVVGFVANGNSYEAAKGGAGTFEQELLIDMLASPRVFNVDGSSQAEAEKSLSSHLAARTGIVSFANQKKYTFASVSGFKMNPAYYNVDFSTGRWSLKPGVDKQTAWNDLNVNPQLYAIGCAAATDLTQAGGSKGAKFADKPSSDETDWVAGESGYVENTKFPAGSTNIGVLGENIIYTGSGQFWGHFTGSVTFRTLPDWKKMVASWHGGSKVDTKRELPMTGLL